jgi:hypothetical protein
MKDREGFGPAIDGYAGVVAGCWSIDPLTLVNVGHPGPRAGGRWALSGVQEERIGRRRDPRSYRNLFTPEAGSEP